MKIIIPQNITDSVLVSSSIPENDYPAWSGATTYARGDYVISPTTHTIYRSLTNSNLNKNPDLEQVALADPLIDDPNPINWQIISATNRWKMFDKKPSIQAVAANEIEITLAPGVFVGGLAGFNIEATNVSIIGTVGGVELYNRTIPMQDNTNVIDWYSYFFSPITALSEFAVTDIPAYGNIQLTVSITSNANVKVGQIVVGELRTLGEVMVDGAGFRGLDFSYVEQDEFGDLTTVRRAATEISDFPVFLPSQQLLGFKTLMRDLRGGRPAVWIGDDDVTKAAINYGYSRDYRTVYKTSQYSVVSLEIQGIV